MEIIKLNLIPSGVNPTCHCSQYDNGRVIRIDLFDGLTPYVLQSGDTVTLNVRKPDNTIVTTSLTATQGNTYVNLVTTEQICACVGYNLCDLTIANGSVVIGTLNFIMQVERDVLADGIPSQSVIEDLDELVQEAVGDNYYTKTETDDLLDAKADKSTTYTKTQVDSALALKANSSDVYTKDQTYNKTEVDSALALKADKATTYTKTETDTALALKADKATTYTKTETDTLLNAKANSSDVYTKTQVDTALEAKADVDGDYKLMTVGHADQLNSTVGEINKTPYNFRTSGGSIDIGDRETDKIIGGTVAFNQLVNNGNFATTDVWVKANCTLSVSNNKGTMLASAANGYLGMQFKNTQNHCYLVTADIESTVVNYIRVGVLRTVPPYDAKNAINTLTKQRLSLIHKTSYDTSFYEIRIVDTRTSDWDNVIISNVMIIDLTAMFGSTIADYIYTLESNNAGAGVAYFRKLFNKSYYAYNAGELMSVKTSAHNTVGFNAYNNTTGKAKLIGGVEYQITGAYTSLAYTDINGDSETITPDSNGKFTPTNNGELTVTGGNATNTCVHIVWDGERDGDFEPYELNSYALDPDLELRGIPKLDANNKLYYDGDTYESDGTVTRKYNIANLGNLNWVKATIGGHDCFYVELSQGKKINFPNMNGLCSTYTNTTSNSMDDDKTIMFYGRSDLNFSRCAIRDDSKASLTAEQFKNAVTGSIVYELETPTTETATAYQNPQIVNDFGTEEYVDTRDVAIPVGHDTFYQANLRAKLEMAPDSPENNGDYLMRHNNGENTYIPYTSPIPSAPTTDATYTLKATVSGGTPTLTWVQDT